MGTGAGDRAASARIVRALRDALGRGEPLGYEQLARAAGCTARTVRNYVEDAERTLGIGVQKERGANRTVRVRARPAADRVTIESVGLAVAREMLRGIFPVEGTRLEAPSAPMPLQIVVAARGAYQYREEHKRALLRWLNAAQARPRRAVRFAYTKPETRGRRATADRVVWPLGIVVRDLARVYLAGMPEEATDRADVRTYALERASDMRMLAPSAASAAPPGIEGARVVDAIDWPFSIYPPEADGVMVHVRFTPEQAPHVEGRLWHRTQRVSRRRDGSLDVRFGPANRGEVEAWVRQWGRGAMVFRDDRPRRGNQ